MKRTFIAVDFFLKEWKNLGLNDENLRELENLIIDKPDRGDVIPNTNGLRKMRFSANNKGKSGGVRVCYLDIPLNDTSIFILVYAKNKKENLSKREEQEISKLVTELKNFYKEV